MNLRVVNWESGFPASRSSLTICDYAEGHFFKHSALYSMRLMFVVRHREDTVHTLVAPHAAATGTTMPTDMRFGIPLTSLSR